MRSLSFIIPVYNDAVTLRELFDRPAALCVRSPTGTRSSSSMTAAWTNGRDLSVDLFRRRAASSGSTSARGIFGQHPAINAGLQRAQGDITVLMDADLQDRPEELAKLIEPFDAGRCRHRVHTVPASSPVAEASITSALFNRVFTRISGSKQPPNVGTYRAFTRKVREALLEYPETGAVYGPLMVQMGYDQTFVTVARSEAVGRKTSYAGRQTVALAVSALISYSAFLHWIVTLTGLVSRR